MRVSGASELRKMSHFHILKTVISFNILLVLMIVSETYIFRSRFTSAYIGFPGQIRKFDNQIHFNFIQIRRILSCRENYNSN